MPLPSRTGVRGLFWDEGSKQFRIDLRVKGPDGKRIRYQERLPVGTRKPIAAQRAREVLDRALAGSLTRTGAGAKAAPLTLGEAFDEYRKLCEPDDSITAKRDRTRHCARLLETLGDGLRLEHISELTIQRHKSRRKADGISPAGTNRELSTLRHFLNRAKEWRWITNAPKVELLPEPPGRVRWLTDHERTAIERELAKPKLASFRRIVQAALLSGQRLGTICALEKSQVDLNHRTLTFTKTKSGKTVHLPISDALADLLREAMAASPKKSAHVFTSWRFRKPYTSSGITCQWRKVVQRAKVKDLHFHDLRHDFATQIRRAGHGLDVVQKLLGHATPTMSQRYAHIGDEQLRAAVQDAAAGAIAFALPTASPAERQSPAKNKREKR